MIDYHVHTTFSEDARSSAAECARMAIARGLGGVIFTEHLEFPPDPDDPEPAYVPERVLQAHRYAKAIGDLSAELRGKLAVGLGVELGLEPHNLTGSVPYLEEHRLPLDYVLGSLHTVKGVLVQFPEYTDSLGPAEAARLYFERLLSGLKRAIRLGTCDVVGHLDVVKRSPSFGVFRVEDHRPLLEEILHAMIDAGLGLEVNTSGWRQAPAEPYPGLPTLRLYRELGGEIVTVGSDSHSASTVGKESARALEFIRAAGFEYLALFFERKPKFVRL